MREVEGKVAFITGAASGIGLGIARAFAEAGLKVMLADIEEDALHVALADLQGAGADVRGVVSDVSDRSAVHRAAGETLKAFGKVHILCNNAGVLASGQMESIPPREWEWVIGVNVMGMIYGVEAFLPLIKSHGEGGHIVNTSSATAMSSAPPGAGPYTATKSAILALSETLAGELAGTAIGVSVLCPAFVRTRIGESARNRPSRFGKQTAESAADKERAEYLAALLQAGMDPVEVGRRVVTAIRDNDLYVFTHPEFRPLVAERFQNILAAYDKAASV